MLLNFPVPTMIRQFRLHPDEIKSLVENNYFEFEEIKFRYDLNEMRNLGEKLQKKDM